MGMKVQDDRIITELTTKITNVPNDKDMLTEIHNVYATYMNPYVPMDEGVLAMNINVLSDGVYYNSPYAHYQFEGVVYGPNIPIFENGVIVGWWSRPNKQPTGASLTYSTEKHPQATHHWNEAMLKDKSAEFTADVEVIVADAVKKGL